MPSTTRDLVRIIRRHVVRKLEVAPAALPVTNHASYDEFGHLRGFWLQPTEAFAADRVGAAVEFLLDGNAMVQRTRSPRA